MALKNGNIAVQLRILPYKDSEMISKENWRFCFNWLYWDLITPISISDNEMSHLYFSLFSLYWIIFWNDMLEKRFIRINNKNDQFSTLLSNHTEQMSDIE